MQKVLITGITGTLGKTLAGKLYESGFEVYGINRNEKNSVDLTCDNPYYNLDIADIRDHTLMVKVSEKMDYCFHLAALKHIEVCERQPREAIQTNIIGSLNVVDACIVNKVKMINMSSDKAVNPSSVYGRTKALVEDMVLQMGGVNIRSGNILWSSGSVLNKWKDSLKANNSISITDMDMTRFFIHPSELADFIIDHKDDCGTFTVPMKSYKMIDLASEFIRIYGNNKTKLNVIGKRPGERLHEYRDEYTSSKDCISNNLNYIFNANI